MSAIVRKTELVASVAEKADISRKEANQAVNAIIECMQEALAAGEKVQIIGFGSFEVRHRNARKGRHPRTGKKLNLPAANYPAFRPGKFLKDAVNS